MNTAAVVMTALAAGVVLTVTSVIRSALRLLIRGFGLIIVAGAIVHTSRPGYLHTLLTAVVQR